MIEPVRDKNCLQYSRGGDINSDRCYIKVSSAIHVYSLSSSSSADAFVVSWLLNCCCRSDNSLVRETTATLKVEISKSAEWDPADVFDFLTVVVDLPIP